MEESSEDFRTSKKLDDLSSEKPQIQIDSSNEMRTLPRAEDLTPRQETIKDKQEKTRAQLANDLIKLFTWTLGGSFVPILLLILLSICTDERKTPILQRNSELVKDLITFTITAQTGLIGTALGFYFGSRSVNSD